MARRRGDRARPHRCEHLPGNMLGLVEHQIVLHFPSHDALVFHLWREHLVRADMVQHCDVDCPMLEPYADGEQRVIANG
jgi:hypothetical protein